jgi:hypothetical protein
MIIRIRNGRLPPEGKPPAEVPRSSRANNMWDQPKQMVSRHPCRSLLASLVAGVALAWIIKRL